MKIFTLIYCCIGLTFGLPNGGYNYNQNSLGQSALISSNNYNVETNPSVSILNNVGFSSAKISPQQHATILSSLPQTVFHQRQLVEQITPIITKNFYVHSAPNDDNDDDLTQQLSAGPVRKHYRIVFIKAPSQSNSVATALRLAQAKTEDKTVIYVLSKKTDLSELQSQLADKESQSQINKPEVYFIKYKTPDEALLAQQQIQAQYDSLGGTSAISDEGFAPVSSVIGALDNRPSPFVPSGSSISTIGSSFLPQIRF